MLFATSFSIEIIAKLDKRSWPIFDLHIVFYELKFTETSLTRSNCDWYGEEDANSNCRVGISIGQRIFMNELQNVDRARFFKVVHHCGSFIFKACHF